MKSPSFEYARAASLEEACALLAQHGDEAKLIAGGQSLVPMMAFRLLRPGWLIDINAIAALNYIAIKPDARPRPPVSAYRASTPAEPRPKPVQGVVDTAPVVKPPGDEPEQKPTATPTPTPTPEPTVTPTPPPTPEATATPEPTAVPTATATAEMAVTPQPSP